MKEGIWGAVEKAFDVKKMETLWEKDAKKIKKLHELQQERDKYKSIVEEINKWLEEEIKQYDNVGLKFKKQGNFECASRSYDYLKQYQTMLSKIKELEEGKDENN